MLTAYLARTTRLLQNPAAPSTLYPTADLTDYINQARGQLAGETSCVRQFATVSTVAGTRNYAFSALNTGTLNGIQAVLNVRAIRYAVASGFKWVRPRPWEWFELFKMCQPVPKSGAPEVWAQHRQGSAGTGAITGIGTGSMASGSFYLDPVPDIVYTLTCDSACYPSSLAADTDIEALPYLFTDAVPYYAAYLALMSAQTNARLEYAQRMMELYSTFVDRANKASAPDVNKYLYERQSDATQINKLGVQKSMGGSQ